jgi:6-pyruvoyltetrahydropterin/6-carboxytetrahydropterin synthase
MQKTIRLARRAYFSAAHKLHDSKLSPQQNLEVFGEQASTHGLGHNYILEVFVEGSIDEKSGMLLPLSRLDQMLKEVTAGLDHKFLNYDVNYFKDVLPTAANVALYCHDFLKPLLQREASHLRLQKVRLYETEDLWVDCGEKFDVEI